MPYYLPAAEDGSLPPVYRASQPQVVIHLVRGVYVVSIGRTWLGERTNRRAAEALKASEERRLGLVTK